MTRFFYLVNFVLKKNESEDIFDLGIFSSYNKAKDKIRLSHNLPGFADYPMESFEIIKFGVELGNITKKENITLYCVFHEYYDEESESYIWNIFDYYYRKEDAKKKIDYLKMHSRIGKKHPDDFDIDIIKVDDYSDWSEGFDSYSY